MADGSYKTFNVTSVKRHQAIHNNAVQTSATPVTFIHQIIRLSEIPVILLPTLKCTNHHGQYTARFGRNNPYRGRTLLRFSYIDINKNPRY